MMVYLDRVYLRELPKRAIVMQLLKIKVLSTGWYPSYLWNDHYFTDKIAGSHVPVGFLRFF